MPKSKRRREPWVVQFSSPDPSHEGINAYKSRAEAVRAAVAFIGYEAMESLEGIDWDKDDAPAQLREILQFIKDGKYDDAIVAWLEFQQEYTPEDVIAIGPSGEVSSSPHEFPMEESRRSR